MSVLIPDVSFRIHELLARVHTDPELEADVFEELDEDRQSKILKDRTDAEVADVLSHMRSDDAADAVMDLPQERRSGILRLLPAAQHTKVMTLLGYHDATAGGLMGTDYLAVPATATIAEALQRIRTATTEQPEALTTIYSLHPDGTLAGVIGLVQALQEDPVATLGEAADPEPVSATAGDDIIDVTTTMADYNLLTLPVLDEHGHILGVITVDDALEAAIPRTGHTGNPTETRPRPATPHRKSGPRTEHKPCRAMTDTPAPPDPAPGQAARPDRDQRAGLPTLLVPRLLARGLTPDQAALASGVPLPLVTLIAEEAKAPFSSRSCTGLYGSPPPSGHMPMRGRRSASWGAPVVHCRDHGRLRRQHPLARTPAPDRPRRCWIPGREQSPDPAPGRPAARPGPETARNHRFPPHEPTPIRRPQVTPASGRSARRNSRVLKFSIRKIPRKHSSPSPICSSRS